MSVSARRGDVWLVDFGEPVGREQSRASSGGGHFHRRSQRQSSGHRDRDPVHHRAVWPPSHIELNPTVSGLHEVSYAKCEDLKSISEQRLITPLGEAPLEAMFDLTGSIRFYGRCNQATLCSGGDAARGGLGQTGTRVLKVKPGKPCSTMSSRRARKRDRLPVYCRVSAFLPGMFVPRNQVCSAMSAILPAS